MSVTTMSVPETGLGSDPVTGELHLRGRIDVHTVPDVRLALHHHIDAAAAAGGGEVVVHLGAAEILDATALGVLVGAHRRAGRAGCRLVLCDPTPRLRRLLTATRLLRVLTLRESVTV